MSHIEQELLQRYLSGKVSPEEAARVETWLAQDPDRWGQLATLGHARTDAALSEASVRRAGSEVWARLQRDIGDSTPLGRLERLRPEGRGRRFSVLSPKWTAVLRIAAALVIAVGAGSVFAVWLRSRQSAHAPAERVAATGAGERATFRLSDGTTVMLGVASTVRYPAAFAPTTRDVTVEGEAYFDVVHDATRPFLVRVGPLVAKDLGTEFTVRLYPEDSGARVVVREGRVAIRQASAGAPEQVVSAGQVGRLERGGTPSVERADIGRYFAWTEGRLVLDGVPLREALPQLGRWFDLDFRLADPSLGDIPLTVSLASQPTPAALQALAAALGLEGIRRDRTVTLQAPRTP